MTAAGEMILANGPLRQLCTDRCGVPPSCEGCLGGILEPEDLAALRKAGNRLSRASPKASLVVHPRVDGRLRTGRAELTHASVPGEPRIVVGALFFHDGSGAQIEGETSARLRAIVESQSEIVVRFTADGTMTFVNPAGCAFLGLDERDIIGKKMQSLLRRGAGEQRLRALEGLTAERPRAQLTSVVEGASGLRWLQADYLAIFDAAGAVVEYQGVGRDVTAHQEREARLQREVGLRATLVREAHHRVRNHLQVVAGILGSELEGAEPRSAKMLLQTRSRIDVLGLLHELLSEAPDPANAHACAYLRLITEHLVHLYASPSDVRVEGRSPSLSASDLSMLGLVASELVSNALVHAFPGGGRGTVTVEIEPRPDGGYTLAVGDDGAGMPAAPATPRRQWGGLSLVESLVAHSGGRLERVPVPRGTRFVARWPCPPGGA